MNINKIAEKAHQIMAGDNLSTSIYNKSVKGKRYEVRGCMVDNGNIQVFLFYPEINETRFFVFDKTASGYAELKK